MLGWKGLGESRGETFVVLKEWFCDGIEREGNVVSGWQARDEEGPSFISAVPWHWERVCLCTQSGARLIN